MCYAFADVQSRHASCSVREPGLRYLLQRDMGVSESEEADRGRLQRVIMMMCLHVANTCVGL